MSFLLLLLFEKEIYVHYRLFLSDDVNFVAFLAFAAAKQPSRLVQSVCVCVLLGEEIVEFSWRCHSCLINVVAGCWLVACRCSCWPHCMATFDLLPRTAWQHCCWPIDCCQHD